MYTNAEFFKVLKQRWSTNFDSLEKNYVKMKIRYNESGIYLKKFEHYPTYYKWVVSWLHILIADIEIVLITRFVFLSPFKFGSFVEISEQRI